jgi:type II secretory pathway component HofQ
MKLTTQNSAIKERKNRKYKLEDSELFYVYKRRKKTKKQLLREEANQCVLELASVTSGLKFFFFFKKRTWF